MNYCILFRSLFFWLIRSVGGNAIWCVEFASKRRADWMWIWPTILSNIERSEGETGAPTKRTNFRWFLLDGLRWLKERKVNYDCHHRNNYSQLAFIWSWPAIRTIDSQIIILKRRTCARRIGGDSGQQMRHLIGFLFSYVLNCVARAYLSVSRLRNFILPAVLRKRAGFSVQFYEFMIFLIISSIFGGPSRRSHWHGERGDESVKKTFWWSINFSSDKMSIPRQLGT